MPELGPADVPAVLQVGEEVLPREEAGLYRQLFPNGMLAALQGAGRGAMRGLDSLSGNYLRDYDDLLSGRERGWRALATLGTPMLGAGVGNAAQWIPRGGEAMLDYLAESRLVAAMPGRFQIPTARVMAAGRDAALGGAELGEGALNGAEAYTWGQRAAPMRYDDRSGAVVDQQGRSWYHDGGTVLEPGGALRPVDYVPDFDEESLYWHHRGELAGGGVQQPGGERSTLYQAALPGPGGRSYNVPTVWDGQIVTTDEARDRAAGQGWRFPSYATPDAADLAYEARVHPRAAADTARYEELHEPFPTAAERRGRELMAPGRDAIGSLLPSADPNLPASYDRNRSFRENALDPQAINNAMGIALGFAGGGMTAKAPRAPLTVEEFEKRILEHKAFKEKFAEAFEKDPRLELTRGDHTFFASPNIGGGDPWRLTSFHAGEPTGHMEFSNLDQLAQEVWGLSGRYSAKGSVRDALGALWRDEQGSVPLTGETRNNMLKRIEQLSGESLEERLGDRVPGYPRRSFSEIQAADKGELEALEPRSLYDRLPEPIRVWHGSGAPPFKWFDSSKIGTGEGNTTYSHGLYFGGAEATGRHYRSNAAGSTYDIIGPKGKVGPADARTVKAISAELPTPEGGQDWIRSAVVHAWLENPGKPVDPESVVRQAYGKDYRHLFTRAPEVEAQVREGIKRHLEAAQPILDKYRLEHPGSLYEADLYVDPARLLDWDAKVNAQSEPVKAGLAKAAEGVPDWGRNAVTGGPTNTVRGLVEGDDFLTGGDAYHALKSGLVEDKFDRHGTRFPDELAEKAATSARLREGGILGVQYLDQVSRNASGWHITPPDQTVAGKWMVKSRDYNSKGLHFDTEAEAQKALQEKIAEASHNYVMYDDKLIDLVSRNGEPNVPGGRNFFRDLLKDERGSLNLDAVIKAFHGSDRDFNAFDAREIGTGQGAQSFGHGLYFAELEKVARTYLPKGWKPGDEYVLRGRQLLDLYNEVHDRGDYAAAAVYERVLMHESRDMIEQALADGAADGSKQALEGLRILKGLPDDLFAKQTGTMYEVGIHADPDSMLNLDRPLKDQPPPVQRLVRDKLKSEGYLRPKDDGPRQLNSAWRSFVIDRGSMSAGDSGSTALWKALEADKDSPAASAMLQDAGVPGIRYLDGASRIRGRGTSNYVIFDPKLVEIVRKYGIGALGLPAGSALIPVDHEPQF